MGPHIHFAIDDSDQLAKEGELAEFVDKAFDERNILTDNEDDELSG
jgi:hypothetical protein